VRVVTYSFLALFKRDQWMWKGAQYRPHRGTRYRPEPATRQAKPATPWNETLFSELVQGRTPAAPQPQGVRLKPRCVSRGFGF
jgi:hypothetical protein